MNSVMKYTKPIERIGSPRQRQRIFCSAVGLLRVAALVVVSFAVGSSPAFAQYSTDLTLINGWTGVTFSAGPPFNNTLASNPSVREVSGIVQFTGAITTFGNNTNMEPFMMPAGLAPLTDVYIPVDMCNATNGRLHIAPNGVVKIEPEGGKLTNATCFTSLDGASFALTNTGFTPLTLINQWTNTIYNTGNAAVQNINGIVHFKGAISTSLNNVNLQPFMLPAGFAPATDVHISVDLCDAHYGQLHITPTGAVSIEGSTSTNAQCFTSLDGAWFAQTDTGFTPLTPSNGWFNTGTNWNTSNAAVQNINGVVYFKGAVSSPVPNPSLQPFVLPAGFTPNGAGPDVYIPVALCGAVKGRLHITSSGTVDIEFVDNSHNNAECFTSLDGASFTLPVFPPLG